MMQNSGKQDLLYRKFQYSNISRTALTSWTWASCPVFVFYSPNLLVVLLWDWCSFNYELQEDNEKALLSLFLFPRSNSAFMHTAWAPWTAHNVFFLQDLLESLPLIWPKVAGALDRELESPTLVQAPLLQAVRMWASHWNPWASVFSFLKWLR